MLFFSRNLISAAWDLRESQMVQEVVSRHVVHPSSPSEDILRLSNQARILGVDTPGKRWQKLWKDPLFLLGKSTIKWQFSIANC